MEMNLNKTNLDEKKINMIKYRILLAEQENNIGKFSEAQMVDVIRSIINEEVGKKEK